MLSGSVTFAAACTAAAVLVGVDRSTIAARRVRAVLPTPETTLWRGVQDVLASWLTGLLAIARARRTRQERERRMRAAVIALCDGLAAELTAGRPPEAALLATLAVLDVELLPGVRPNPSGVQRPARSPDRRGSPTAVHVSQADGLGSGFEGSTDSGLAITEEMGERIEQASRRPGAEGLRLLAACWRIGAERGGTFASVVDELAMALRDEEAHREEVAAQLAGPRATARLLAGLPLLGLAMAAALGAHPVAFLLGTWPGIGCLILGAALDLAGLAWTRRIAESAESPA